MNMTFAALGIDVSKLSLSVCLMQDKLNHQSAEFQNTADGHVELSAWLKKSGYESIHICLESTGQYGYRVATYLHQLDYPVSIVNPTRIKGFAQSLMQRNKSDAVDARVIAQFCLALKPEQWHPPAKAQRDLQELMRRLSALESMLHQERNRTEGDRHPEVAKSIAVHIQQLEAEIERLEAAIEAHFREYAELQQQRQLLTSIPGIGDKTAAHILAEVGDIRVFTQARQLAAYCGLTPRQRQSGTSVKKRPCLSKVGNSRLRKALFMPAICATRYNPVLGAFYERLREKGKSKMAAVGAVMRKLLHIIFGVLKHQQPFNPNYSHSLAADA